MAELLNLNTIFLQTSNYVHTSGEDADNWKDFRLYRYDKEVNNIPLKTDGIMLILRTNLDMPSPPIAQIAFTSNGVFYYRFRWYSNNWTTWKSPIFK